MSKAHQGDNVITFSTAPNVLVERYMNGIAFSLPSPGSHRLDSRGTEGGI
jgi:hypothetical protein